MFNVINYKGYIVVALVAAAAGGAIAKFYWPTTVSKEVEVVRNNIVTQIREITKPDGTKEVTTVTSDNSTKKSTDTKVTASVKPSWHTSISGTCDVGDLRCDRIIYGVQVEYNFIGPFSAGVRVDSSKQVGLVLGLSF